MTDDNTKQNNTKQDDKLNTKHLAIDFLNGIIRLEEEEHKEEEHKSDQEEEEEQREEEEHKSDQEEEEEEQREETGEQIHQVIYRKEQLKNLSESNIQLLTFQSYICVSSDIRFSL